MGRNVDRFSFNEWTAGMWSSNVTDAMCIGGPR
jgi:hypothetical protein